MPGRPARRPTATPVSRARTPGALRPGAKPGGRGRHTKPVRRASAGLTPVRAGAALALLVAVTGLYGAVSSDAFELRDVEVTGLTWTERDDVLEVLGIPQDTNLFSLPTGGLAERLAVIPAIRGATIAVELPDRIRVDVYERQALLAWHAADRRYLVDADGLLFDVLDNGTPPAAEGLPVVVDQRTEAASLSVGTVLDPVTLDAALRLGSLRPADLGSAAGELEIALDDSNGFVLRAPDVGWSAVFGFYTPTLRTTDLIPGQVRLLRSLLAGREDAVLRVILADDRSGTYEPRPTDSPKPSPRQ
jgi:cell division septal protein FtsQ